jgi:mono/diheme cytochrome c family protein
MKNSASSLALTLVAACVAAGAMPAVAADKFDFGKREYESNCAVCHGMKGKGDGPYAGFVQTKRGLDLTGIQKRNGGIFPLLQVLETIDGRRELAAHGARDMPIWGRDYLARSRGDYMDVPYDAERYVDTRIVALADYLFRLQAK